MPGLYHYNFNVIAIEIIKENLSSINEKCIPSDCQRNHNFELNGPIWNGKVANTMSNVSFKRTKMNVLLLIKNIKTCTSLA